jgi:hypothetical protein
MSNLCGIETPGDCRAKIDELLEMCDRAQRAMSKDTMKELTDRLKEFYDKCSTQKGMEQMSDVESAFFWRAIQGAYLNAPKLSSRKTWGEGLVRNRIQLAPLPSQRLVACRRVTITRLLASRLAWPMTTKSCSPGNSMPT